MHLFFFFFFEVVKKYPDGWGTPTKLDQSLLPKNGSSDELCEDIALAALDHMDCSDIFLTQDSWLAFKFWMYIIFQKLLHY